MADKALAERIVNLREKIDMKQSDLAKKLEIDKSAMSKIESGDRKVSSDELKQLSSIFKVSIDYLVDGKENNNEGLTENQKLIAYSIDPDITDEEREAIIEMAKQAKKFRRRI